MAWLLIEPRRSSTRVWIEHDSRPETYVVDEVEVWHHIVGRPWEQFWRRSFASTAVLTSLRRARQTEMSWNNSVSIESDYRLVLRHTLIEQITDVTNRLRMVIAWLDHWQDTCRGPHLVCWQYAITERYSISAREIFVSFVGASRHISTIHAYKATDEM